MSQRPPDVRITDFDAPDFSPDVREMIEGVAPLAAAIPWTLEAALEQDDDISQATTADDLERWARSIREDLDIRLGASPA